MQIDLDVVEFRADALLKHQLCSVLVLNEEREKFGESSVLGEVVGRLIGDDGCLTIVAPVYHCACCLEEGSEPIAHILIDRIKSPGWRFKAAAVAQA